MTRVQVFKENASDLAAEHITEQINREASFQKMDVKNIQWYFGNDYVTAIAIFEQSSVVQVMSELATTIKDVDELLSTHFKK